MVHAGDRRDPVGVVNILEMARGRGLDPAALAVAGGLDALRPADAPVLAWQELAVIEAVLRALPDQDPALLGLETGLCYRVSAFGLFGWAMLTRAVFADALALWARLPTLGLSFSAITARYPPGEAIVFTLDDHGLVSLPRAVHRFLVARGLVSTAVLTADLLAAPVMPMAAGIDIPPPSEVQDRDRFHEVLGPHLVFGGGGGHRLVYHAALAGRPLPFAHPVATRTAERAFLAEAARRGVGGPMAALDVLLRDEAGPPADLVQAARRLAMSERSLRRRLAAAGTSFRQRRDAALAERARRLLVEGVAVERVAIALGYADAAAFTRAFRRWTGETPGRFARSQPRRSAMTASSTT
ncbi:AraC family transcriptional regulator [Tistrella mobilis]|jgi:AraC-like DNA-binding protein|uniref:Transcriptional regulator, AraC family protein n=1 Tax=Tistrella mobilis (strain KA081020-065) TaxID=1110502 RepID=I3TIT2_TISMK|nr:AraC family transcriptional regulator [Tistrella mobilis]AFK52670.1 Transcriptional regulator, AraC family protein [Tistrella mobilis KA081020-065]